MDVYQAATKGDGQLQFTYANIFATTHVYTLHLKSQSFDPRP